MLIEIKSWLTGGVLFAVEAENMRLAIEAAIGKGVSLSYANLSYAHLSYANLSYANLSYADLRGSDLRSAYLSYADLRYADLRSAHLSSAYLSYANLRSANLRSAHLSSAYLSYADLRGSDLRGSMILDTGETWKQYLTETVPELLIAGGKPIDSFGEHFACHEWANCPMAHAFDTHDMTGVPRLLQHRADQFIRFFDAGKIPWPLPTAEQIDAEDAQFDAEFDANRAEAIK